MKGKKKAVTAMLATVVLLTGALFGTLAYFTDQDAVSNTFTVGKVEITLDELDADNDDNKDDNVLVNGVTRDKANKYHLIPGQTYIKDPTIHVGEDSEDCYLFVKVENGIADIETADADKTIAKQMERLNWVKVTGVTGMDNLYILAKGGADKYAVSKEAEVVVFESFTVDGEVADLSGYEDGKVDVKVTAYAVQKAGFENSTPEEIWAATFGKTN